MVTETYPPEVNGVAMTLGRLVEGLLERGHAVQVIRPRQDKHEEPKQHEHLNEVLAKGFPIPNYKDLRFGLPAQGRLVQMWRQERPDIVHVATEGPLGWTAVSAARKLGLPITSSFHTNFHHYSGHYRLGLLKAPIESYLRKLHNRTMATLVPTRQLREELSQRGYQNLGIMARGVNIALFNPARRSEALRQSWGATPDDLVVICVGRLAKEKNLSLLLAAFATIQNVNASAKLVLVGDGPLRQTIQETCPGAILAGVRIGDDLATHYASADLFVFPSLSETFGNVVPEALASGLAVLAYQCAAAAELIESGRNGQLVPEGNAMQFVRSAHQLAELPNLIQAFRSHAAASVAHLDWAHVNDAFVNTLRAVIDRNAASVAPSGATFVKAPISQPSA